MNHKVFFALLACLLFSSPAFTAAEPVGLSNATRIQMRQPMIPHGDGGPVQAPALTRVTDVTPAPPKPPTRVTSLWPAKRAVTSPQPRPPKASPPRMDHEVWMSWVALVAGAASLGMALAWAYILIFYGGPALLLIVIALLLAVLAIALGAICLGSLQKKPSVRRGLVAVILGVFFFVWPFIALFHYIIIDAFS